jgi:hypothetical protein
MKSMFRIALLFAVGLLIALLWPVIVAVVNALLAK